MKAIAVGAGLMVWWAILAYGLSWAFNARWEWIFLIVVASAVAVHIAKNFSE